MEEIFESTDLQITYNKTALLYIKARRLSRFSVTVNWLLGTNRDNNTISFAGFSPPIQTAVLICVVTLAAVTIGQRKMCFITSTVKKVQILVQGEIRPIYLVCFLPLWVFIKLRPEVLDCIICGRQAAVPKLLVCLYIYHRNVSVFVLIAAKTDKVFLPWHNLLVIEIAMPPDLMLYTVPYIHLPQLCIPCRHLTSGGGLLHPFTSDNA